MAFCLRSKFRATWGFVEFLVATSYAAAFLPKYVPTIDDILSVNGALFVGAIIASLKGLDNIDKAITGDWKGQKLGRVRTQAREIWWILTKLRLPPEDEVTPDGDAIPAESATSNPASPAALDAPAVNLESINLDPKADLKSSPAVVEKPESK